MINALIDKQDTFEIISFRIAQILTEEVANQMALATAAGEDPELWKLRVYHEAFNPFEQWLTDAAVDKSPIVNVWYHTDTPDLAASNPRVRQTLSGTFNVDIYAIGTASDDAVGHIPADVDAAYNSHRALRLVRNILMHPKYMYLGQDLKGTVSQRMMGVRNWFQPNLPPNSIQRIVGGRIAMDVRYNEYSQPETYNTLEQVNITVVRDDETGEMTLAEIEVNYPLEEE